MIVPCDHTYGEGTFSTISNVMVTIRDPRQTRSASPFTQGYLYQTVSPGDALPKVGTASSQRLRDYALRGVPSHSRAAPSPASTRGDRRRLASTLPRSGCG